MFDQMSMAIKKSYCFINYLHFDSLRNHSHINIYIAYAFALIVNEYESATEKSEMDASSFLATFAITHLSIRVATDHY